MRRQRRWFLAAGTRPLRLYLNTFLYLDSRPCGCLSEPVHDLIYTLKYFW